MGFICGSLIYTTQIDKIVVLHFFIYLFWNFEFLWTLFIRLKNLRYQELVSLIEFVETWNVIKHYRSTPCNILLFLSSVSLNLQLLLYDTFQGVDCSLLSIGLNFLLE